MNAVVYCRVSSRDQIDGTSLASQETACREYTTGHGLSVQAVFVEEGESAKYADRTRLLELLDYCRDGSRQIGALLVWKLDRFARNIEDHYAIKAVLRRLGVGVVSVTEPVDAEPNGKLMEAVLAGFAQFDNDIRPLRSVQGMQARLHDGIWPWKPPLGYLPPKIGKKTQPDRLDPDTFPALQEAWKLFATGAYSKAEVRRLLHRHGVRGYRGQLVSAQLIDAIFRNPYYAGVLRSPWNGDEHEGRHIAMVTTTEFAKVQTLIDQPNRSRPHRRFNADFPLRGLVRCPSCERYFTGAWSRGRRQRYAYYSCFRRNCRTRGRSYPIAAVHAEFHGFLKRLSVSGPIAECLVADVEAISRAEAQTRHERSKKHRASLAHVESQLHELIGLRTEKLISDEEFTEQRARLRQRLAERRARANADSTTPLTRSEAQALVQLLPDLSANWRETGSNKLILPSGYVYRRLRTAETGLLFRAFAMRRSSTSKWVDFVRKNSNTLIGAIREFLGAWTLASEAEPTSEAKSTS